MQWRTWRFRPVFAVNARSAPDEGRLMARLRKENASRPVSRVLYGPGGFPRRNVAAIPLGRPLPDTSRDPPGQPARKPARAPALSDACPAVPIRSCSRWGLPCRRRCRRARWALTPPFHPSRDRRGGLLSVALSLGLAACLAKGRSVSPAGRYPASCFHGARTFLHRTLSGPATAAARPADTSPIGR